MADPPSALKSYADARLVSLDRAVRASRLPAVAVLSGQRADPAPLDAGLLSTLLFLCGGVTRGLRTPEGRPVWFRAAPSAGNLHPVEIYVVREGVWHYAPLAHGLAQVREPGSPSRAGGATLVLTGIPARTCFRYGDRGFRHLYWDAGAMLANLLAAADAHGVAAEVVLAFDDAEIAALVGADGVDEAPLALVRLGADAEAGEPLVAAAAAGSAARARPLARHLERAPLVVAAQRETALRAREVAGWHRRTRAVARPAPAAVTPPHGAGGTQTVEEVILRRGSPRIFRRVQAPAELLAWGLAAASRSAGFDVAPGATTIGRLVNVHDVEGAEPGRHRWAPGEGLAALGGGADSRQASVGLCLGQRLAGDAAFTVFHVCALEELLAAAGGRGYRVAQLEAGLATGRLALAATALGHGATGLTFYDEPVRAHFGVAATPLLATAVGVPGTRPPPSGAPGRPHTLRRLNLGD